jgi:hypothetical protein
MCDVMFFDVIFFLIILIPKVILYFYTVKTIFLLGKYLIKIKNYVNECTKHIRDQEKLTCNVS